MKGLFKISSFSVITAFICISLIGFALIPFLPFRSNASIELPKITISFRTKHYLSPRIVENKVTKILEQALNRTEQVISISSVSYSDNGRITLDMNEDCDIEKAKFDIATNIHKVWDRISEITFYPEISSTTLHKKKNAFIKYSVSANLPVDKIEKYIEHEILPKLSLVQGVKNIEYNKTYNKSYLLIYDKQKLDELQIESHQIESSINQANSNTSLGIAPYNDIDGTTKLLRIHINSNLPIDKLKGITVSSRNGKSIALSSLVEIVPNNNSNDSNTRINGQNTLFIDITAKNKANEIIVGNNIKATFQNITSKAPQNITIKLETDDSEILKKDITNITIRSVLTIIILLIFIVISTNNKKVALTVILSMLSTLLISIIGYHLFNVEMNMYAMAGITISLTLIIDNTIVMSSQILRKRNINVFQPMLAATLTTIGALSIVFFLSQVQKAALSEFAKVLIINLSASLFTSLFLVPALMDKMNITYRKYDNNHNIILAETADKFNKYYEKNIIILCRHRILLLIILILSFGLPIFLLPVQIHGDGKAIQFYNKTFGSDFYNEKIRPKANLLLGGALYRLYKTIPDNNNDKEFQKDNPTITISASVNNNGTPEMILLPIKRMERYLSAMSGIDYFVTNIFGNSDATIDVYIKPENIRQGIAQKIRDNIINTILSISGISWNIKGPGEAQFTNTVKREAGKYKIKINGYDYDELNKYACIIRDSLDNELRVKDLSVSSSILLHLPDYSEFNLNISKNDLIKYNLNITDVSNALLTTFGTGISININDNGTTNILHIKNRQSKEYDLWNIMNQPLNINGIFVRLADIAKIKQHISPMTILKHNQEYGLYVQFNYKGSYSAAEKIKEKYIKNFSKILPLGFSIENGNDHIAEKKRMSPLIILVIIAIIFVTTSILLDSLRQPFAIILIIPVSFIGLFLTFAFMNVNIGMGGMAALVLLCGQTVNTSIYLTYEYNIVKQQYKEYSSYKAFVKSWDNKIQPISLTILSTILGFLPFIVDNNGNNEFWYSLSLGTIAGLATSIIGIFVFLPAFLVRKN